MTDHSPLYPRSRPNGPKRLAGAKSDSWMDRRQPGTAGQSYSIGSDDQRRAGNAAAQRMT